MQTIEQQSLLIREEQIITPLIQVLDQVKQKPSSLTSPSEPFSQSITDSLNILFPEQRHEDKDIQKARNILGDIANNFNHEQIKDIVMETQCLVESWLDDFERGIFRGKTLKELLHEKGM